MRCRRRTGLHPGSYPRTAVPGRRRRALRLVFARHQLTAQQLADRRLRDRLDEDVTARALEVGEPGLAAEPIELLRRDTGAALDEGGDDLAPALVLEPDHRHLRYRGMQRQAAFDL